MTGLIETVRIRNGSAPLWALHMRRLATSGRALSLLLPSGLERPSGGPDRIYRLQIDGNKVTVTERELGASYPIRLITARVVHQPYPHKTTARAQFDEAAAEARRAGADEGLLLSQDGWVAETSIYGVFWWEDGRLCAPPLDLNILPGVARARLAALAGVIVERRAAPQAIVDAGLFLANAARGVVAVASWDRRPVGDHPLTGELRERFWG